MWNKLSRKQENDINKMILSKDVPTLSCRVLVSV